MVGVPCVGGVGLLIKLLLQEDADMQAAAIHALSVVTVSNDYNCRSAVLSDFRTSFLNNRQTFEILLLTKFITIQYCIINVTLISRLNNNNNTHDNVYSVMMCVVRCVVEVMVYFVGLVNHSDCAINTTAHSVIRSQDLTHCSQTCYH